ncbi:MAG TPA: cytochrome b/b6 domain-containing protein [Candidatus Angelobacter sp.]|nr:cytochrome b/b6 domain-containing protein [Candidatus Angelobacter sp.]
MKRIWVVAVFLLATMMAAEAAVQATSAGQKNTDAAGPAQAKTVANAPNNDACTSCHSDVADKVKGKVHGAVACQTCHVKHEDYPHPDNVAKPACSTCHSTMAKDYANSAHAQAVKKGNGAAPECSTCHGKAHEMESAKTAQFRGAVPELCGACHSDVLADYQESVHGVAMKNGVQQAPVCTDCHGEHSILPPENAASTVHPTHVRDTCAGCHNSVQLSRRFGIPSDRIVSFDASYHGLASKSGGQTVANCASCHGVHNIRASSDPKSTINPSNLAKTCGHCHEGAGKRFALGPVHSGNTEHAAVRWIRWIYLAIIPLTIGFMFLHNFGDWLHKLRRLRFSRTRLEPPPVVPENAPLRTFPFERIQHATLAISFIVLAWTGFALKYPDQWWARPTLLWENSHSARGLVHRGASVVFMAAALAHILSLLFNKRLRDHWRELFPKAADLRELARNFAYNLGLLRSQPERSSHSYVEKMEYWALVWGSVVMIVTGVLLWGNTLIMRWLPKLVLDIATSIHFYEAVLATLAIVVWHFYFVIFDPDVYPMDSAWLTGKSPRKESTGEARL